MLGSAESQSALLDVLDVLKAADVDDRVRAAAETIYPSVVQRVRGVRVLEVVIGDERAAAVDPGVERRAADCRTRRRRRTTSCRSVVGSDAHQKVVFAAGDTTMDPAAPGGPGDPNPGRAPSSQRDGNTIIPLKWEGADPECGPQIVKPFRSVAVGGKEWAINMLRVPAL